MVKERLEIKGKIMESKHKFIAIGETFLHEINDTAYTFNCKRCDLVFTACKIKGSKDYNKLYKVMCKANKEEEKKCKVKG